MDKKTIGLWAPIVVIAAALLMLAVSTAGVDAAPRAGRGGGKGKPGGATTCSTCVLTVSPNPIPAYTPVDMTITGSGFTPGQWLRVEVYAMMDGCILYVDSAGGFTCSFTDTFWRETYTVRAVTADGVVIATTTFTPQ